MKSFSAVNQIFKAPGRAINLDLANYDLISITHCQFIHTAGIFIQAKPEVKILIENNTFNEIIKTKEMDYAQAIQVSGLDDKDSYNPIPISLQILNNKITNTKGVSDVEDCINLIMVCRSDQLTPLHISGNTISGAYPKDTSAQSLSQYSGGGVICDRGCTGALIERNFISETTNYGIGIAGGSNNVIRANTVSAKYGQNVGIYCYNAYKEKGDPFLGNYVAPSNQINWVNVSGKRNDLWVK